MKKNKTSKTIEELSLKEDASMWNDQYSQGLWENLKQPCEYDRFNTVIKFIENAKDPHSILEIGCGEGILQTRLKKSNYSAYLGIDISDVAISMAKARCNAKTEYIIADMETFETDNKYDIIVFSESIYYATNPVITISKFSKFLEDNGVIMLSIYLTRWNQTIAKLITDVYKPDQEILTKNQYGKWSCIIYNRNTLF